MYFSSLFIRRRALGHAHSLSSSTARAIHFAKRSPSFSMHFRSRAGNSPPHGSCYVSEPSGCFLVFFMLKEKTLPSLIRLGTIPPSTWEMRRDEGETAEDIHPPHRQQGGKAQRGARAKGRRRQQIPTRLRRRVSPERRPTGRQAAELKILLQHEECTAANDRR